MKIHIDTASEEEKAKAKKIGPSSSSSSSSKASSSQGKPSSPPNGTAGQAQAKKQPKPNLPKSPPKEPKPPTDVRNGRKVQTTVLKERQKRETQGNNYGSRDIDAGAGFWPPLSPLL